MPRARIAAVLVFLAAPLAASAVPAQMIEDTPGCSRLDVPKRIRAIHDLLDLAALTQGLAQHGLGPDPMRVLVSVRFDREGAVQLSHVLATDDVAANVAVQGAVLGAVLRQPAGAPWGIRLLLVLGDDPHIGFERAELCPPQLLRWPDAGTVTDTVLLGDGAILSSPRSLRDPVIRVLVDEDGHVQRVTLRRGTGNRRVDQALVDAWQGASFRPATLDRVAIEGWYQTPDR